MWTMIRDNLIKPFFAIAFFLAFGGGFVFGGYTSLSLESSKDNAGHAVFHSTEEHLGGIFRFKTTLQDVKQAELADRISHHDHHGKKAYKTRHIIPLQAFLEI